MNRRTNMADQQDATSYSCEGTLLVPTVDDRVSHWRERLVSGNRLTIILKVVGQRWSSDAAFLLWGENCLQEKVFEVNLRYVRAYCMCTRTWHEITSSDRRRFALSFHDSTQFARFFEELESTLSFLKKLTKTETQGDAGGIVVLRVDKMAPPKPPRAGEHPSPSSPQTPPFDERRVSQRPQNQELIGGVARVDERTADIVSEEGQSTKWYVNICDGVTNAPPVAPRSPSDNFYDIYETIVDPPSIALIPDESSAREGGIDTYDNITDVTDGHPGIPKSNGGKALGGSSGYANGAPVQSRRPAPRKSLETQLYDDRAGYDNSDVSGTDVTLDFNYGRPIAEKSKPRLPPPRSSETTGNRPAVGGVTDDESNRRPNRPVVAASGAKPQPLPRTKKPKDFRLSAVADDWTCHHCTLINPSTENRCVACAIERHGSRDPPVTGSRGDTSAARDDIQRLPSAYVVPSACFRTLTAEEEGWSCSVCSATNGRDSDVCHSCLAWICGHCTLHNSPELWVCSVCSHSRLLPHS